MTRTTTAIATLRVAARERETTNLWLDAWHRLIKNKAALLGLAIILGLGLLAMFAEVVAPHAFAEQNLSATYQSPSAQYLMGTDQLGRDVFSRLIYGARISLTVGFVVQVLILVIGVPLGALAGYFGRWIDQVIMRVVDILYAFPDLLLIIVVMTYLRTVLGKVDSGPLLALVAIDKGTGGLLGVFMALALTHWLTVSRLVRGQILSLKEKEFVEAARCIGAGHTRIVFSHLIPNTLAPIIVAATFGVPAAIILEAGLSFLGLGAQAPTPSWGIMISEGITALRSYPHLVIAPAAAVSITVLSFNFFGDGLRDALDPWMKK